MDPQVSALGAELIEIAARHTIDWVSDKITTAKTKKVIEEQQIAYEEIINKLIQDKLDLQRIAQQYKQEIDSILISDEDIVYLQDTLRKVVDVINSFSTTTEQEKAGATLAISILNKDLLKTIQLIGFNYKDAIGKPLTEIVAKRITAWGNPKNERIIPRK